MTKQRLHFRVGEIDAATELVRRYHYTRRVHACPSVVGTWHEDGGLFGDYGPAVAACIIVCPSTAWREPVWELNRLVRAPHVTQPLTGLIAATLRHAAKKGIDLVVSYADWQQDHHGGVYQAGSWHYAGYRPPKQEGLIIDGKYVPNRTCSKYFGSRRAEDLQQMFPDADVQQKIDRGKYLYWRALTKEGRRKAERLGLKSLPYPKPNAGGPDNEHQCEHLPWDDATDL